ncbi:uncharacterized protein KQ657_003060 [Scheffersomyces spartinae]|uniref:Uncharacterized protein n=1 Tax=Scheffersomyces spartinae TaxID=45513 RepID=A0A9P7V5Z5_9ASCO|nr:uncharacterized protein KQ657_003060 [Scheffersomyces spartinae]KAG7191554.1 hypothetical protein KQ657_003060 [Scheffersomyces spartinae]
MLGDDVNPSEVLSQFFQQKGNTPLTQVEYEGVMALLLKSKDGSGNGTGSDNGNVSDIVSSSANTCGRRTVDRANVTTSHIQMPGSFSTTPNKQKSLRNTSLRERSVYVSTPEYKPHYKSINNTVNIPSIKRVYQFSGLPSPYKTKIRPPPPVSANTTMNNSTILPRNIAGMSTTASSPLPASKKPLSETANTLLSILDGKLSTGEVSESDREVRLKQLSNPYGRGSGLKRSKSISSQKQESSSSSTVFTADDISKTIAYDQTKELPEPKKPLVSVPDVPTLVNTPDVPKPLVSIPKPLVSVPKPMDVDDEPRTASTNTNGTVFAQKSVGIPSKPMAASSFSSYDKTQTEYIFPQIKSLTVQVDEGKVEEYKKLFNFN